MPVHEQPQHDGSKHIEFFSTGRMAVVVTERGQEYERKETTSIDDIFYWMARDEAHRLGSDYELDHRHPTDDFRRVYFAKAEEEIGRISAEWARRLSAEHAAILKSHPFSDDIAAASER